MGREALVEESGYRSPVNVKRLRFIYSAIEPGMEVLELGCGNGGLIEPLARAGHTVVACDIQPAQIPGVEFVVADALTLDLGRTFDAVIMSEVIEHVTDPAQLLGVAERHLNLAGCCCSRHRTGTVPTSFTITS
jgi:2-polyprenyl-3-methyl-5-hydroxy-6-metoxy-1,4-benzoquinol methylase